MKKIGEFKPDEKYLQTIIGDITKDHLSWRYALGMSFNGKRHNAYRDDRLSLQKEGYCNKTYWYIDGDEREFKTVEAMLEALNEAIKPVRERLGITVINPLGDNIKISLK